jgi:hypothetical protein
MASDFFDSLMRQFSLNDTFVTARKVEYGRVLYMIAAEEESATELRFDSTLVDGDKFFVKKKDNSMYVIREFMPGFARLVLDKMLKGAKQALSTIDVRGDRFLLRFTGVPQLSDLAEWDVSHWLIGIPPAGYTGIDFVLA